MVMMMYNIIGSVNLITTDGLMYICRTATIERVCICLNVSESKFIRKQIRVEFVRRHRSEALRLWPHIAHTYFASIDL